MVSGGFRRVVVSGRAQGAVLATTEPLSFWGGYDAVEGRIIDRRHPLVDSEAAGCILVMPCTRGSSTTTQVLLEAIRRRTAPAAIVTDRVDHFLALASIVAEELYDRPLPLFVADEASLASLRSAKRIEVDDEGWRTID